MPDRIITFQYAKAFFDEFRKKEIPYSKECMTRDDVEEYINADMSVLNGYVGNRLIPRIKVIGKKLFKISLVNPIRYYHPSNISFTAGGIRIDFEGGLGKVYKPEDTVAQGSISGGGIYKMRVEQSTSDTVITGNGYLTVYLTVTQWYGSVAIIPITVYSDVNNTVSDTVNLTLNRYS